MFEILQNLITTSASNIKNSLTLMSGAFWFTIENYRKRYPYVLLGEKKQSSLSTNHKETILLYRISGKRYAFECSATELCNSKALVGKFHPLDVRIISFIAGVEQVLKAIPEERMEKFENLKEYIFNE